MSRLTRDGMAESVSRDLFSGANGDREIFVLPVQLTTSRIDNLARLIHTLLTYLHWLDRSATYPAWRWAVFFATLLVFIWRIYALQGYFVVVYGLGILLLSETAGFLTWRRIRPESQCWISLQMGVLVANGMTLFTIFDLSVFWPILLAVYLILAALVLRRSLPPFRLLRRRLRYAFRASLARRRRRRRAAAIESRRPRRSARHTAPSFERRRGNIPASQTELFAPLVDPDAGRVSPTLPLTVDQVAGPTSAREVAR